MTVTLRQTNRFTVAMGAPSILEFRLLSACDYCLRQTGLCAEAGLLSRPHRWKRADDIIKHEEYICLEEVDIYFSTNDV